ncbi:hypothetical protein TRVL_08966 [Trypanosoma vivax]|nr:hypothetical protein TRVL_08966 [Trypanosoma vivax]
MQKMRRVGAKCFSYLFFIRRLSCAILKPGDLKPKAACHKAFTRIYWSFATKLFTIVLSLSGRFLLHYNCKLLQTNGLYTPLFVHPTSRAPTQQIISFPVWRVGNC